MAAISAREAGSLNWGFSVETSKHLLFGLAQRIAGIFSPFHPIVEVPDSIENQLRAPFNGFYMCGDSERVSVLSIERPEKTIQMISESPEQVRTITLSEKLSQIRVYPAFQKDLARCAEERQELWIEGKRRAPAPHKSFEQIEQTVFNQCFALSGGNRDLLLRITEVANQELPIALRRFTQLEGMLKKKIHLGTPRDTKTVFHIQSTPSHQIEVSCVFTGWFETYQTDPADGMSIEPLETPLYFESKAICLLSSEAKEDSLELSTQFEEQVRKNEPLFSLLDLSNS